MMNISPRKGAMLLCGRLPPAMEVANGFICTLLASFAEYKEGPVFAPDAQTLPVGSDFPPPDVAWTPWLWAGISLCNRVTVCSPAVSPRSRKVKLGPCPACMGAQP